MPLSIQLPNKVKGDHCSKPKFIICADTSFSGDTQWMVDGRQNLGRGRALSSRGDVAVSEVLMKQCSDSGRITSIQCHGTLSDGSPYETVNYMDDNSTMRNINNASCIGRLVDRSGFIFEGGVQDESDDEVDWWIKSRFSDGKYLVVSNKGYDVFNSIATER